MRVDAVTEVAARELAQTGLCSEVFFSDSREINLVHGTERAKPAEALAGRAATELQAGLHIVE
jgi:hypothetical protein